MPYSSFAPSRGLREPLRGDVSHKQMPCSACSDFSSESCQNSRFEQGALMSNDLITAGTH